MVSAAAVDYIAGRVRALPDHPVTGVTFRDIMPLLADPVGLQVAVEVMASPFQGERIDLVVGIEARGFILGAPVALSLGAGFVPVRKPGKLPGEVVSLTYALEYGIDTLEIQADAVPPGARVAIVDDVLATGGTAAAAAELVRKSGGEPVGLSVLLELTGLAGRQRLDGLTTHRVVEV